MAFFARPTVSTVPTVPTVATAPSAPAVRTGFLAGFLAALAAGCGPDSAPPRPGAGWDGTVDTVAPGRTVVRNGGAPLWDDGGGWRLVEVGRVGGIDAEGPAVLGEVRAVEVDAEGRMYVLDAQAAEVRVFGPRGGHLRTLGSAGEGPGELGGPAGLAWGPGGALWVMDFRNARYTAFDPETGRVVAERRRPFGYFALPWPGGFDRAGRLRDVGLARIEGTPGVVSLIRMDTAFAPTDTLRVPEAGEENTVLFARSDGTPVMSMPDPFAPRPVWALRRAGGIVAFAAGEYVFHDVAPGGDTVRTVSLNRPRPVVTAPERDSALAAFREIARDFAGDASPSRQPRVPDRKPAVRSAFEDHRDHLWVRPYLAAGEPPAYDVFDPEGRYLGRVELPVEPGAVHPAVRGARMVVAVTDELGVPAVVGFRIEGR